jgi:ABC-2 type transport system ATP-binding protein
MGVHANSTIMSAIETDGLTKEFGDVTAVEDLDLVVDSGEVYGFLGPNGAGKSTTINMLLDFIRPTEGRARVLGHDPTQEAKAIRQQIGVLPEGGELYERLTGREHLRWYGRAKDVEVDVEAILDTVGLSVDEADRPVGGYSKGMQQRLAFGMALVGDPELLILDEPSSGLDPTGMQEMREIIRAEADAGRTVFFSSHILGEVEAVCDRIGIMNEGLLVAEGTIDELREQLDVGASIQCEVAEVPAASTLESIEGVRSVTIEGDVIETTLSDDATKVEVVKALDRETRVLDILSEDTSLEQLFNQYTGNGQQPADAEASATLDSDEDARESAEVAR